MNQGGLVGAAVLGVHVAPIAGGVAPDQAEQLVAIEQLGLQAAAAVKTA